MNPYPRACHSLGKVPTCSKWISYDLIKLIESKCSSSINDDMKLLNESKQGKWVITELKMSKLRMWPEWGVNIS